MRKLLLVINAKLILVWLLLFALFGCGGNSSDIQSVPNTSISVPKPRQILCLFGDSTQYSRSQFDYLIQTSVSSVYPDSVVYNFGITGADTQAGLNGIPGFTPSLDSVIDMYGCTVVTANYAINDVAKLGVPTDIFISRMKEFESTSVSKGAIFLVETPNPIVSYYNNALEGYVEAEKQNFTVVDHFGSILTLPNWQAMLPDGVHPGEELLIFKTKLLSTRIKEELDKKYK